MRSLYFREWVLKPQHIQAHYKSILIITRKALLLNFQTIGICFNLKPDLDLPTTEKNRGICSRRKAMLFFLKGMVGQNYEDA